MRWNSLVAGVWCVLGPLCFLVSAVAQVEPIKIGMNEPLTGRFAPIGIDMVRGAQLAVDEINRAGGILGRPLKLIVEDNKGEVELAISAADRLANVHKVDVVVGPTYTYLVRAIHEIYWKAGVPQLMTATHPTLTQVGNPFLFRLRAPDNVVAKAMVVYAVEELRAKRIAIAHQTDDWGIGAKEQLVKYLRELYGLTPVAIVGAHIDLRDYTGVWMELKRANPDLVITYIHGGVPASLYLRTRREFGLTGIAVLGSTAIGERVTIELAGIESAEGVMMAGYHFMDEIKVRLLEAWYHVVYKEGSQSPCPFHMYDAINLVAEAIRRAGVVERKAIRDALIGLQFEGVLFNYFVRENGETTFEVKIGVVRGGVGRLVKVVSPD